MKREFAFPEALFILGIVAILLYFWQQPLLYPFKLFVVLMHEFSHGLAAIFTGGIVESITFDALQGGMATTIGGSSLLITSAGYIGSFLWGLFFLALSNYKKIAKIGLVLLSIILLILDILYVKTFFAMAYTAVFAIMLFIIAIVLNGGLTKWFLKILGILTCLYAIMDIKSDLFFNKSINDAIILSKMTGIPAIVYTILWSLIIIVMIWFFILTRKATKIKKRRYEY